jgi:uncharacterized protein (UPF0332 family)
MTMAERLLWLAQETGRMGAHSLTLKHRAVSDAYYAVFHAIAALCANELLPGEKPATSKAYERVYRALEHSSLKSEFNKSPLRDYQRLREVGVIVMELQRERHNADYMPTRRLYTVHSCNEIIKSAETAMNLLKALSEEERRVLAVTLLFKNRP